MRRKLGTKTLLLLVLTAVLLSSWPGSRVIAYANNGDDYVDELGGEDEWNDWEEDEEASDEADGVNEESSSAENATSSTSARLDDLYQERDQIQSNIEQLKNREQELEANIANAQNEKEKAIAERNSLAYEISLRTDLIAAMQEKLRLLGEEVELRQLYIQEKQEEIDDNYRLLQKRLGAMYMQDDGTMLGLLIGSDSFSEFLTRSEYMVLVTEHDRNLLQELTDQRISIEEEKAGLEDAIEAQEADKAAVEDEKAALDDMHVKAAQQVQSIDAMEQEYLANLAENKALQDAAQAELDEVFQQIEWSKNPYAGGVMAWPLPGFSTISSSYGPRFGGNDFHTGMDITGSGNGSVYGATITAAADGVVNKVNLSHSPGYGYGIYLIVDHGVDENGRQVATLYAHCSAITASLGQQVKAGDPIAQVGSTGWSTGPHLHFEVRLDGNDVEPSQYLQG